MDINSLIGLNIKKQRMEAKISQEELAARINADQAYISRLEAGSKNPTLTTLQSIAEALNIDIEQLIKK